MKYNFRARNNQTGKVERGKVESGNKPAAFALLQKNNLTVISVDEEIGLSIFAKSFFNKVSAKDKVIFTRELAIMIRSGLSIIEALKALQSETDNKYFAGIIEDLVVSVQGGKALSVCLAKHSKVFGEIYSSTIQSGEISGKIDLVLDRLATQIEKDFDLNRKVKGAMSYPAFVLITLVAVMVLIMVTIIPQLKNIFDDAGVELPALTRTMIGISFFLRQYGLYVLIILIGLFLAGIQWNKTKDGRHFFDLIKLKIPVLGLLLKKSYIANFCRTFASLAGSGLPLLDVFSSAGRVIGNTLYEDEVNRLAEKVKNGISISKSFSDSKIFPRMMAQMSMVGERSGNIDEVFDNMADFYERDVEAITSNISALLEPILMVVMGVGIGLIIISVLQPIYGLVNAI